jgi:phosphoglycerate kinase
VSRSRPIFLTLDDLKLEGKTVLVRAEFNSPVDLETKKITGSTRIRASAATIKAILDKGGKVAILAHQGRLGDPDFIPLKQHSEILSEILERPVKYVDEIYGKKAQTAMSSLKKGEVLVLENVRGFKDETKNLSPEEHSKSELVQNLAPLVDIFVHDAFGAAHRSQASLVGFTPLMPSAAGLTMERELTSLAKVASDAEKPCTYVLGGAKPNDSVGIAAYVLERGIADKILVGGLLTGLFLIAEGYDLSGPNEDFLNEKGYLDLLPTIKEMLSKHREKIDMPSDVAVDAEGKRKEMLAEDLPTEYSIFDLGSKTAERYAKAVKDSKTVVLNGPLGVYERDLFMKGTRTVFTATAESEAFSLVGGGHTITAIEKLGLKEKISYISTGGKVLLDFLMGKNLPGVEALKKSARAIEDKL